MTVKPTHSLDREHRLDEILTDYLESMEAGRALSRQELLARHPDLAMELAEFFTDQDRFESALGPIATPTPPGLPPTIGTPRNADGATILLLAGERFGDYDLLEEIARGGMGVVYKVRHRPLQRLVALKMILAGHLATSEEVQRFRLEAEAAARLDHPHIVPIYDVGEVDGQHYYTMKLIDGGSLAQRLAASGERPSAADAAQLVATAARAVHHAHQRGTLHRDLKPANILLTFDGEPEAGAPHAAASASPLGRAVPLVTDFGLAKRMPVGGATTAGDLPTPTGTAVGTPSYMAPEQATNPRNVTTAADVYSLGAILYELLAGRPPFRAETPLLTLLQVVEGSPDRPSAFRPTVERDLETICLKCLEMDPAQRYPSAAALAEDLERFLRQEPIQARPVGRLERLYRWCQREPILAGTLGLLLLVLTSGLAVAAALWMRAEYNYRQGQLHLAAADREKETARLEKEEAVRQYEEAERQRKLADQRFEVAHAVVDEFCVRLSEDRLKHLPSTETLRREMLQGALKHFHEFLRQKGDDPALRAEAAIAHYRLGELIDSTGHPAEALKEYEQARDLYDELLRNDPDHATAKKARARTLHQIAILEGRLKQWATARASLEKSRAELLELSKLKPDDYRVQDDLAVVLTNLGGQHLERGQLAESQRYLQEALELREKLVEQNPTRSGLKHQLAVTCGANANLLQQLGQRAEAARHYRRARDLHVQLTEAHPSETSYWHSLAMDLRHVAQEELAAQQPLAQVLPSFQEAERILEKLHKAHPQLVTYATDLASVHRQFGVALVRNGRRDEGLPHLDRALELMKKVMEAQPDQPRHLNDLAWCHFDRSVAHSRDNQWEEALRGFEAARDLHDRAVRGNPEHVVYRYDLAMTLDNLGGVLWNLGRREEGLVARDRAGEHFRVALQAAPQFPLYRRNLSRHYESTARMLRSHGRTEQALALIDLRAKLWPTEFRELHLCARETALMLAQVGKGRPALSEPERQLRQRLTTATMELLRQAVAAGFKDGDGLEKDSAFSTLREHDEFRQLVSELKSRPAAP